MCHSISNIFIWFICRGKKKNYRAMCYMFKIYVFISVLLEIKTFISMLCIKVFILFINIIYFSICEISLWCGFASLEKISAHAYINPNPTVSSYTFITMSLQIIWNGLYSNQRRRRARVFARRRIVYHYYQMRLFRRGFRIAIVRY